MPRFREEDIAKRMGESLKGLQVPPEIAAKIVSILRLHDDQELAKYDAERRRLQSRLTLIRGRMNAAYNDKLDGEITEEHWKRKRGEFQEQEHAAQRALEALTPPNPEANALDVEKIFELANSAYFLDVSQNPAEQAKLLKMVAANYVIDGQNATPTWRFPFDRIFERAKMDEWSGRLDSN